MSTEIGNTLQQQEAHHLQSPPLNSSTENYIEQPLQPNQMGLTSEQAGLLGAAILASAGIIAGVQRFRRERSERISEKRSIDNYTEDLRSNYQYKKTSYADRTFKNMETTLPIQGKKVTIRDPNNPARSIEFVPEFDGQLAPIISKNPGYPNNPRGYREKRQELKVNLEWHNARTNELRAHEVEHLWGNDLSKKAAKKNLKDRGLSWSDRRSVMSSIKYGRKMQNRSDTGWSS